MVWNRPVEPDVGGSIPSAPTTMEEPKRFLEWLEEQDGRIRADVLEEEWPDFPSERMGAVTMTMAEDGTSLIPKRDLRQTITRGQPLD